MAELLVCSGARVLLPGISEPSPATIVVNKSSGKIIEVREGQYNREQLGLETKSVEWVEAGNSIVLPGLVECVCGCSSIFRPTLNGCDSLKTVLMYI